MRQRVSIARALAVNPAILLMDEPFASLDVQTREYMQDELLKIWQREPKTVIFVTHSIDEAIKLSDRIAIMAPRPGRIEEIKRVQFERPRDADESGDRAARRRGQGLDAAADLRRSPGCPRRCGSERQLKR